MTGDLQNIRAFVRKAAQQEQFLAVVDRDEADTRFRHHLDLTPRGLDRVTLDDALGRVLAEPAVAAVDVPAFDRSGVDGFAVRAADTIGAAPHTPLRLKLNAEVLAAGRPAALTVEAGTATVIATGGMVPRGADAVIMVEHTEFVEDDGFADGVGDAWVELTRPATPGQFVASAGSDIGLGETVLRAGQRLGPREIAMLAATGIAEVMVWKRPTVAILSTGDEIVAPGAPLRPAAVYDSNAAVIAATVRELGGEPLRLGIARDDEATLTALVTEGLKADALILSGGTSKGAGDLTFRVVERLTQPGIVVHGVALKPGKPLCLAANGGKPVVVLPGFPTSAMFTFHEFVAPILRALCGERTGQSHTVDAILPVAVASERARTEYVMVSLVERDGRLSAYPLSKGSGAVTAFGLADGFFAVPAGTESLPEGTPVSVQLIGRDIEPADLVIIGSQCLGLDRLAGRLTTQGIRIKLLSVGSMGGLRAARNGECDIAPVHLLDPATDTYNRTYASAGMTLVPGYRRRQGLVFRPGDPRFAGKTAAEALAAALADPACLLANRNPGSGTRILLDRMIGSARPPGYWSQARTHNAVAAAVSQHRADWGFAIEAVASRYGLGFTAVRDEHYDFIVPENRLDRPAVRQFLATLGSPEFRTDLKCLGFEPQTA